ncbi:phage antirepressor [Aerococcus urinaeequi]|uniref:phage antirepressor n=1 Tax=Aerococcus urinaeequi TaxID=51665 RepID=UPI003D6BE1F5
MNEPQLFNFEGNEVRTVVVDNEPYFVGKDVADTLGYARADNAIRNHVDDEDKLTHQISASGQNRNMTIINESGLYALIFGSKLESAKRFKRWVTSEVLPAIRKHGAYATARTIDDWLNNPDMMIKALEQLKTEREQRLIAEQQVNELQPKATYYDLVLQNKSLLSVSKIAKDYGKSAIWLNNKLHELGIQFKQGDTWLLYQKHADKGYTQSTTHVIDDEKSRMLTKWTQKGRLFIYELLKDEGVLPLIEAGDDYANRN